MKVKIKDLTEEQIGTICSHFSCDECPIAHTKFCPLSSEDFICSYWRECDEEKFVEVPNEEENE